MAATSLRQHVFHELFDHILIQCTFSDVALKILQLNNEYCNAARSYLSRNFLTSIRPLMQPPFHLSAREILHESTCIFIARGVSAVHFHTFAKACSRGALPQLKKLWLKSNEIGDAGCQSLADVLSSSNSTLSFLEYLDLRANQIGDEGATVLATAFSNGAMLNLRTLDLSSNEIGENGLHALSKQLALGRLPKLSSLFIDYAHSDHIKLVCAMRRIRMR